MSLYKVASTVVFPKMKTASKMKSHNVQRAETVIFKVFITYSLLGSSKNLSRHCYVGNSVVQTNLCRLCSIRLSICAVQYAGH